jgi:hypothetical protein
MMAQEQPKQEQPPQRSAGGDTVTVACKLPNGVYLRVFEFEEYTEQLLGGGVKQSKRSIPIGEPFKINGNAVKHGKTPRHRIVVPGGDDQDAEIPFTDGYALTQNVPRDLWERWLSQNKESALVQQKLIYASPNVDRAEARALDQSKIRSGLEPLSQERDPRAPRGITKGDRKEEAA